IKVALKVLVSEAIDDQDIWAKGEYEALTRLRHPNLARVYNFGRIGDTLDYFIVSEFIKGIDLYSATEYLDYAELADIIVQICRALEYIHSQGYVHFDIKPDNILVTRYKTVGLREGSKVQYTEADLVSSKKSIFAKPNVKLIDFGLAEKITGSFNFAIKGTLNYLAPEILNGQTPDKRADLYSLGVTLYQVANRDLPFHHEAANALSGEATSKRSDLFGIHMKKHPEFLRLLILKLLEESPEDRFQSAKDVIQFINKHSDQHFEIETPETRASYFYAARLVGRRRELNLLKELHERCFFPRRWHDRVASEQAQQGGGGGEARTGGERRTDGELNGGGEARAGGEGTRGGEAGKDDPPATVSFDGAAEGSAGGQASATGLEDLTLVQGEATGPACPALILVTGEMGSGKSRLLEEFQHFLKLNDTSHVAGNCYEAGGKAYQPILEILRQLVYSFGLDSELCRKYRADLLRLLPEIRAERDEEEVQPPGGRPDKEKLYFIERMSQLLVEAAQIAPYVLVVNNLHWVDEASVGLLEALLVRIAELRSRGEQVPVLVLASLRPDEILQEGAREMLERLKKAGQCQEIPVRRLKRGQIQEFLCSMLGFTEVPEAFVTKLEEKTAGNPLFIVETLKALEEDGVIRNQGDGWAIRATSYDRIEIPQSMEDLLEKRLSRIGVKKRELLDVLSVIDKPANPRFLQAMKRFEDTPILVELRDLEQSGLVVKAFEGGKLHFQITQPKVREILYSRIPDETRRRYHGEVGAVCLELHRGNEEEILEEAAYHYQRSDQTAKAVDLAIKAGDRLKAIYANERAYEYYLYVLDKAEGDPAEDPIRIDTHEKLGDLCTTMGRYDVADRSYCALLQEDVRKALDPRRVVKIQLARGRVFEIQGDYEQALKCYKDARNFLSSFDRKKLVEERIRVFNAIGWVYVCMGKYEKAMAISLEALRVIESGPERIEHAMVYNTIGSANFYKGNIREAIEYHRRSLQIRENLENVPEITNSLNNLGSAHMAGTEYGEAADLFQRALKTSEEIGDPYGRAVTLHNLARLYFAVGQPERGWQALEESLKLSKLYNMRYLTTQNYIVRGKALRDQGEHTKAEGNFFRVLTAFSKQGNRWGLSTILLQMAELHRLQGRLEEARAMLGEGKRYAEELDIHNLQALCRVEEARLAREAPGAGDSGAREAARLLEEARERAEKCENPELLVDVSYELGETMVKLRRLREAPEHYKAADEKIREILDSLPEGFREGYAARQKLRYRDWKAGPKLPSEPAKADPAAAPSSGSAGSAGGGGARAGLTAEDSLRRVNELMVRLCAGGSLKDFLGRVLDEVLGVTGGDGAFFLSVQGHNVSVDVCRGKAGRAAAEPEEVLSLELVERVIDGKRPLLLADLADDPPAARALEAHKTVVSSLIITTFLAGPGRAGVLYVVNPELRHGEGEKTLWLIQPFLNLVPLAYAQLASDRVPAAPAKQAE
ncbi:MAG: tetratricopeptide repeat protein, partial [Planctomycetes bacterium]|nr:tetratricopeptide repeat protein [Planctomycetota bacterium]